MDDITFIVPEEDRVLVVVETERTIEVPGEIGLSRCRQMALLGSKQHTVGNTTRWLIDYSHWLDNTATIEDASVASSSTTCTVSSSEVLGKEVVFFLIGGELNERLTVSLIMTDNLGNIKNDTIAFTCIAP